MEHSSTILIKNQEVGFTFISPVDITEQAPVR